MILAFVAIVVVSALLSVALMWCTGRPFRANVVDARQRQRRHDAAVMLESRIRTLEADVSEPIEDVIARVTREVEEATPPTPQPPDQKWVTLYHPQQGAVHRVPNNPVVVADFRTRGWILEDPSADTYRGLSKPTRPNPARDPEWR